MDPASAGPARLAFFGSGPFAVPILEALAGWPRTLVVGVITAPDRPGGRGGKLAPVPVAACAAALGLIVIQPPTLRDGTFERALSAMRPELAVLADFGRIVPGRVLAVPKRGFLNVHPSLLPRHRGATPVAGAILAGDTEMGVSIMVMDEGLDTGPILAATRWPLAPDATADAEERRASEAGATLALEVIGPWLLGERRAIPQDTARATLTRPLVREDGRLDPSRPAAELERRVRAFRPWPGTFLETSAGRLAIHAASVAPAAGDAVGLLVAHGDGLALSTKDGRLVLDSVQPAGGRSMSGAELRRGKPALVGQQTRLRSAPSR